MKKAFCFLFALILSSAWIFAQPTVIVDENGVMRWKANNEEIRLFGVNYTMPFAHGFRAVEYLGENHKDVVDADVYHMARLGLDAHRIHVWDSEISDSLGNLIQNKHLDILDYAFYRMKERGIKTVLTPMKVGGNGYPEPGTPVPGFTGKLSKQQTYSDEVVIEKQKRYFTQFINHVNPYTGIAYKDDPDFVALEINNEPAYGNAEIAKKYIETMIQVIREAGFENPILENVSQNASLIDTYSQTEIQGCTFQWYPTGLVSNQQLSVNFLPNVDEYRIPFSENELFKTKTRIVYEFSPADTRQAVLYPAMARSFREAKIQFAAQFAYDPIAIAASNTEYQTHFMNLAFTPRKALGMMIASKVFHQIPNGKSYGRLPENLVFENTLLDYDNDLAEWNSPESFIYTNNTKSAPIDINTLSQLAGYGNSPIVHYTGMGIYFLDLIENGVWRLEVMPDAVWMGDPFSHATPRVKKVAIKWIENDIQINLPELGQKFAVSGINANNNYSTSAINGQFKISPGVYILSKQANPKITGEQKTGNIHIGEYYAPKENFKGNYLHHSALKQISEGQSIDVNVDYISSERGESKLGILTNTSASGRSGTIGIPMERINSYQYRAVIPASVVLPGYLSYTIKVENPSGKETIYPGGVEGPTNSWEYYNPNSYTVKVIPSGSEVELFHTELTEIMSGFPKEFVWSKVSKIPSGLTGESKLLIGQENRSNGSSGKKYPEVYYAFDFQVRDVIKGISNYADNYSELDVYANAMDLPVQLKIILIDKDAGAFSAELILNKDKNHHVIKLKDLKRDNILMMPMRYPNFLPIWQAGNQRKKFELKDIERIQIILPRNGNTEEPVFEFRSIILK
jgi:hypothetical protein